MTELQPLARIALRYLAMFLMTKGYLSESVGSALMDPATLTALSGAVVGIGTEIWYRAARKKGGAT